MFYICTNLQKNIYIDYFIKTHNIPHNPKMEGDLKKNTNKEVLKNNVFIKLRKQIRQERKSFRAFNF